MTSSIVSINLTEKHKKMLAKILKARGYPDRGRSAYMRACIEADYLLLQEKAAASAQERRAAAGFEPSIFAGLPNNPRRKASTTKAKTK
jgi:hypothetical protein